MKKAEEKILLVDDEPRVLAGLKRNLGMKYNLLTAESAAEAEAALSANGDVAVIIADMQMPGRNGVDLLKSVKKNWPHVRRLMLTGDGGQETTIAAVNDGAVMRFIRKPSDPDTIEDAIDFALDDYRFEETSTDTGVTEDEATVARNSFLSMMNHEMRTPLNHVIGLSQLIKIPETEEYEESREYLNTLKSSADHLLSVLSRMLEYSRISSKEVASDWVRFNFMSALNDEIEAAKTGATAKGVILAFDTKRRDYDLFGAEDDIRLAIREILDNAVKFNKSGGQVAINIRCNAEKIAIKISDNGAGISKHRLAEVTGAFQQANEGHDRDFQGIGLGLSLASLVAERHGGSISISSVEGKGTSVVIVLESARAEAEKAA